MNSVLSEREKLRSGIEHFIFVFISVPTIFVQLLSISLLFHEFQLICNNGKSKNQLLMMGFSLKEFQLTVVNLKTKFHAILKSLRFS